MDEIGECLECPICRDTPRPGMPGVGLCPVGHYVCHDCTVRLNETIFGCPICRQKPVKLHTSHHFIMSIVKMYYAQQMYTCSFEPCNVTAMGSNILAHEKTCPEKPIPCPKVNCSYQGPISVYLNHQHECFVPVDMSPFIHNVWSFIIPLHELFSVDNNTTACSEDFQLRFLTKEDKSSQAYFNFTNRHEDLVFNVGWLDATITSFPFSKYRVHMTVENHLGHIGGYHEGTLNGTDGLHVTKGKLIQWACWLAPGNNPQYKVQVDIYLDD